MRSGLKCGIIEELNLLCFRGALTPLKRVTYLIRRYVTMDTISSCPQDNNLPQKRCYRCCKIKPLHRFSKHKSRSDGLQAACKDCQKEYDSTRTNSPNYRTKAMRVVGFSRKDYEKAWQEQNGKCAICGNVETDVNQWGIKKLAVDHDHKTGEFRGLLCKICNIKLHAIEDQYFVEAAKKYLRKGAKLPHEFPDGGRLL